MSPERLLSMYEIYKRILNVKGSIVELGVGSGGHINAFLLLRRVLEPWNSSRRIIGFDMFGGGIPSEGPEDAVHSDTGMPGTAVGGSDYGDTREAIEAVAAQLSDIYELPTQKQTEGPILELVKGDIKDTLPDFIERRPHLIVSLLSLDADMYMPTRLGLELLLPRMPSGAVIVFDELDAMRWPGETRAVLDVLGISNLRLERVPWERDQCYAVL